MVFIGYIFFGYFFTFYWAEPGGIGPWSGLLTAASLHKWHMATSDKCKYGGVQ